MIYNTLSNKLEFQQKQFQKPSPQKITSMTADCSPKKTNLQHWIQVHLSWNQLSDLREKMWVSVRFGKAHFVRCQHAMHAAFGWISIDFALRDEAGDDDMKWVGIKNWSHWKKLQQKELEQYSIDWNTNSLSIKHYYTLCHMLCVFMFVSYEALAIKLETDAGHKYGED